MRIVEGFADYYAVALLGVETGLLTSLESNAFYTPAIDGSRVEGTFASFLHDLTDAANESFDTVQFPGTYVGDLIATCFLQGDLGLNHLLDTESAVACFENRVDPWVRANGFFPSSTIGWTTLSHSATQPAGWSQASVRAIWLRNLYGT